MNEPTHQDHLHFSLPRGSVRSRILIPKYYDPELDEAAQLARAEYELPCLGELLLPGSAGSRLGTWIRREHYGSGTIPFVRTSDLNGWRLRPDYKKGVAREVYEQVADRQDVQNGDILMVAHGTYLVGTVAVVAPGDLPLVLQDHVFRLRLGPGARRFDPEPVDSWLLLAALSTRFVRRQIRARQFSADIIDKIGDRHLDVRVPIPADSARRKSVSASVREIVEGQTRVRAAVSALLVSDMRMTRERSKTRLGFSVARSAISRRILIPKYYDPSLQQGLSAEMQRTGAPWVTIGQLVGDGLLGLATGVEVGKMAYGTGTIPFIRTTDIAELEVKADPRQGVSRAIYDQHKLRGAVAAGDVLLVRDGTYLVGSSALVTSDDTPALICGGLYRLRSFNTDKLAPATLLGLLNLRLVRYQMRSKQFTRDVIDTLGRRLLEVMIPEPTSAFASNLGRDLDVLMAEKGKTRARIVATIASVEPAVPARSRSRPGWSMRG